MRTMSRGALRVLLPTLALGVFALAPAGAVAHSWTFNGVPLTTAKSVAGTTVGMKPLFEFPQHAIYTEVGAIEQKGTVGPGAVGEITSITSSGKTVIVGEVCGTGGSKWEFEALHLPWSTELATVGGVLRDVIKSGGHGVPKWKATCKGGISDECEYPTNTGVFNVSLGVEATFDEKSPEGECPFYGKFRIRSKETIKAVLGGTVHAT
jgi:hypothetical protein